MKTYYYKLTFSPYSGELKAKNKIDAFNKVKKMFSEYNINKVLQYLQ